MATTDPYGLVGELLDGQFRVDRAIGEGGFSVVYRGLHIGLDEPVAIKCLKLQAQLGSALVEGFIRRFRDESKIHYRLSRGSLNIARSIAAGTTTAPATNALVPYMVLEWLDGYTLAEELRARRMRGEKGRPIHEVVRILDPVAEAMAFAHAQGVVHRDLNPSNVFVAHSQGVPRLKVLDFGVAKVVSDHALALGPRAATLGQIRMFTPPYGAPEQFNDLLSPITPATDVYAFALMVVELLSDRMPIEAENIGDIADKVLDRAVRPTPRSMGVQVGDSLEHVLARALDVDAKNRPGDVGEFWGMLKNAVGRDSSPPRSSVPPLQSPPTSARTIEAAQESEAGRYYWSSRPTPAARAARPSSVPPEQPMPARRSAPPSARPDPRSEESGNPATLQRPRGKVTQLGMPEPRTASPARSDRKDELVPATEQQWRFPPAMREAPAVPLHGVSTGDSPPFTPPPVVTAAVRHATLSMGSEFLNPPVRARGSSAPPENGDALPGRRSGGSTQPGISAPADVALADTGHALPLPDLARTDALPSEGDSRAVMGFADTTPGPEEREPPPHPAYAHPAFTQPPPRPASSDGRIPQPSSPSLRTSTPPNAGRSQPSLPGAGGKKRSSRPPTRSESKTSLIVGVSLAVVVLLFVALAILEIGR